MPEASSTGPGQGRAIRNANGKRGGAPIYIAAAAAARRRRRVSDFFGLAAAAAAENLHFVTFRVGAIVISLVKIILARSECNKM